MNITSKINHHLINEQLKQCYENNTSLKHDFLLSILNNEQTYYIANKSEKINFIDIDEFDNYFPEDGILSLDINIIIEFINDLDIDKLYKTEITRCEFYKYEIYGKINQNDQNQAERNVLNSFNNICAAIAYDIDLSKFNYYQQDLQEVISLSLLLNNKREYTKLFEQLEKQNDEFNLLSHDNLLMLRLEREAWLEINKENIN